MDGADHNFLIQRRDISDCDLYIKHKDKLWFNDCKNVLSIVFGDGYIDSFLVTTCMPFLKKLLWYLYGHCESFLQLMQDHPYEGIQDLPLSVWLQPLGEGGIGWPTQVILQR